MSTINMNPLLTSVAAGTFATESNGFIQGVAMADPAYRNWLAGGYLDPTETLPMWGGVGVSESVPGAASTPQTAIGGPIKRATGLTSAAALTGFSVFDQAHALINSPQSPVPQTGGYGQVNFYRLGSQARIPVAVDPALVSLAGGLITAQVSWDFAAQRLVKYAPAYNAVTITGASWSSSGGGLTTLTVGTDLSAVLVAGDTIDVSGVVSTGGSGAGFNGTWVVNATPSSTQVVVQQPAASSPGTYSSGGTIAAGGGALPVKVLNVNVGNSMTVNYDPVTGYATWNRIGSCALILI